MASSLLLRRATAATPLLNRITNSIRSAAAAPSVSRSFNTDTQVTNIDQVDQSVDTDRRDRSVSRQGDSVTSFFTDVFDPYFPTRSLSQVLNLMDQMMDTPFLSSPRGRGSGSLRGWNVKEDKEALYIRIDMPGVDKDNVKIRVDQNTLIVKGEGEKESEEDEHGPIYSGRLELPPNVYKLDQIKAEMKNGVLKLIVPNVKEEGRKVHEVKVE
ncbi:unnamed protein product [Ilex paraguariensis]|uniref:SHSP domain-containing protein n=1 Tax=Ilex paraguariensis TaxID=185542 RepID=A0ABC8TUP2_9AQUA